jgi:hypothetical protein
MAKPNLKAVLLVAFLANFDYGQTPAVQQKSEKSTCTNILALTGDVNMNCSNLTPAQKKALADIPAILKMALSNQGYLEAILKKLNDLSQPSAPITTNIAPGGFAVSGGYLDHPTINKLSEPLPQLLGFELIDGTDSKYHLPLERNKQTVTFRLYTDTSWNDPQFVVLCNRPCYANYMSAENPGVTMIPNFRTGTTDNPNLTVFLPIQDRPFPEGVYFLFQVASKDDQPIKILRVEPVHVPLTPQ